MNYYKNNIPPHKILGIAKNASIPEIKTKYKELVKIFHPDKYNGSKDYAAEQFVKIDNAYKTMISHNYQRNKNISHQNGIFYPNRFNVRRGKNHQSHMRNPQPHVRNAQSSTKPVYNSVTTSKVQPIVRNIVYPNPNQNPNQNPNGPRVLCNGTVLCSGNFHPSNITYETLQKMRMNLK